MAWISGGANLVQADEAPVARGGDLRRLAVEPLAGLAVAEPTVRPPVAAVAEAEVGSAALVWTGEDALGVMTPVEVTRAAPSRCL